MPRPDAQTVASTRPRAVVVCPASRPSEAAGSGYRDLNGNGRMDPYEDPAAPIDTRIADLLGQMTREEKAGLLFHTPIAVGSRGHLVEKLHPLNAAPTSRLVQQRHLRHFNILTAPEPRLLARWHNALQRLAERTRLGIPVTVSSDPRHALGFNPASGIKQDGFSVWPSQLGIAATGDVRWAERFGTAVREEFLSVGLRTLLGPMADVATEPRWGRSGATFGEDAARVGEFTAAFIRGLQGGERGLGRRGVSCMVKHFPGGGPTRDGVDPHFARGARQAYPGGNFEYHLGPFRAALAAGARQVMVSYGIPSGQTSEEVAMAFNREIVTELLRDRLGFDGVVCSDWMSVETRRIFGVLKLKDASAWGVESLSVPERYAKALRAGVDQFGGESDPRHVADLMRSGVVPEERIDESVRRILRVKFELGLFDDPYVDEESAPGVQGMAELVRNGLSAQRRSLVLLANRSPAGGGRAVLPAKRPVRLYVKGVAGIVARQYGDVVRSPRRADLAVIRVASPKRFRLSASVLEYFIPQGDLTFAPRELARIVRVCRAVPTIVDVRLDRPAVIPEIAEQAAAVIASFGAEDAVLLDAVFGSFAPTGRLPVEVASSMRAILASRTDVPRDTRSPLFPCGHGLSFAPPGQGGRGEIPTLAESHGRGASSE